MFNLDLLNPYGDFPVVPSVSFPTNLEFVPFNKFSDCFTIPHFFIDDAYFEKVWKFPLKYKGLFSDCRYMIMPDFSIYYDIPLPLQLYNSYRSKWLASFYSQFCSVLPNVSLGGDPALFPLFSKGFPVGSDLAFSFIGSLGSRYEADIAFKQYYYIQEHLRPARFFVWLPSIRKAPGDSNVIPVIDGRCKI